MRNGRSQSPKTPSCNKRATACNFGRFAYSAIGLSMKTNAGPIFGLVQQRAAWGAFGTQLFGLSMNANSGSPALYEIHNIARPHCEEPGRDNNFAPEPGGVAGHHAHALPEGDNIACRPAPKVRPCPSCLVGVLPVRQGPLRDFASLRVLARPLADP